MSDKRWTVGVFLGLGLVGATPVWAQFEPTRMQMCSAELGAASGDERKKLLTDCLRRRLEGEKIVERDCRRQTRDAAVDAALSKAELQKQCVQRALQAHYTDLPRRPPPAPKPAEPSLAATPAAPAATPMPVSTQQP